MAQAVTSLIRDPQVDGLKLPPYSVEAEQLFTDGRDTPVGIDDGSGFDARLLRGRQPVGDRRAP